MPVTRKTAGIPRFVATDAPSSYAIGFTGTRIDYSDEEEGRFTPRQTAQVEGAWTLRLNPILSTIVGVSYYTYSADNEVETEMEVGEIDAGLVWQPDANVRVRGGLGYAKGALEPHGKTIGERRA